MRTLLRAAAILCGLASLASLPAGAENARPPHPFGGNRNYYLNEPDCRPIRDVEIEIEVREALVSRSGLGFQLNAHTLRADGAEQPPVFWQQYMMGITVHRDGRIVIHDSTQNWGHEPADDPKGRVVIDQETDVFDLREATIPAGARFLFRLHDDEAGNIVGAEYDYVEPDGRRHPLRVDLAAQRGFRPGRVAPISGYQMNLVGPKGSALAGGSGVIRYRSAQPLVAEPHGPACTATHVITAENINSSYSELPREPMREFEQRFDAKP